MRAILMYYYEDNASFPLFPLIPEVMLTDRPYDTWVRGDDDSAG